MTGLRAVRDQDALLLAGWSADVQSEFDDFTGPPPAGVVDGPRTRPEGYGELVVTDDSGAALGSVSWHRVTHGPGAGSAALNLGISLRPEARGQGHGSRAQRQLADFLFRTTAVHRLEASTDMTNLAEQKALSRAGFSREGVLRGAQWRRGAWHDLVVFSRLRTDA